MRAVVATSPGDPEVLVVVEEPDPEPGEGEVLIDVVAAGLNRADLVQRRGLYPPPPGASTVLGMECSGTIAAVGEGVVGWKAGDEVCALLAGGGYASRVTAPAGQVMPVPTGIDLATAAALPEVACTVWSNVVMTAGLQAGEAFLVHGGAGGIGSFAIQLAKSMGARVFTTAGSHQKAAFCASLGADVVIDYHEQDFVEVVRDHTDDAGVDVILDNIGARYLDRNLDALRDGGRLCIIGLQGGARAELDLNKLMRQRRSVTGTTLRSRTVAQKSEICRQVAEQVWPLLTSGAIHPVVHATLPLERAGEAHALMESGAHSGKILLAV